MITLFVYSFVPCAPRKSHELGLLPLIEFLIEKE
ncbi:MAG: hypothetical protein RL300_894 [Pseudomonadota bacterium]